VVERDELMDQKVRLAMIGRRDGLPPDVAPRARPDDRGRHAENTGDGLCLAINYGGRTEIADAAGGSPRTSAPGRLDPERVDEATVSAILRRRDARPRPPDPDGGRDAPEQLPALADLLRRALGDRVLWPDFRGDDLLAACVAYLGRRASSAG
jgi:undecaprenyl diphosphate synthase